MAHADQPNLPLRVDVVRVDLNRPGEMPHCVPPVVLGRGDLPEVERRPVKHRGSLNRLVQLVPQGLSLLERRDARSEEHTSELQSH